MTLTLRVPAPTLFLSSNRRLHWATEARATKAWRDATFLYAKAAKLPRGFEHVTVSAVVHPPKGSKLRDAHNISVKAAIDGLVDYGLVPDDDSAHLRFAGIDRGPNDTGRGFLVLLIEPTDREGLAA